MARAFKRTYTRKIPPGAVPCTVKGKPAVKWQGRGGRVVTALVSAGAPGRCVVESPKWYAEYRDHTGRLRKKPGYTDKAATEALAAKLEQQHARIEAGLLPPEAAAGRRPMAELLDAWGKYLADGNTADHAERQRKRAAGVVAGVGAVRPSDLTPAKVLSWVAGQRKLPKAEGGINGKTASHYVGAVKQFTRWLVRIDRSESTDHLLALAKEVDETDPRHERRVLDGPDFGTLIRTTRASTFSTYKLTGPERAALYLTASSTGLRANELASLVADAFDLAAPSVTAEAAYAKGRRRDTLPLPVEILADLRPVVEAAGKGAVWPVRVRTQWKDEAAEMLKRDLRAAGIPYRLKGRVFDFHALRSQFCTDLDRAGVSLQKAQRLMRHCTPALTTRYYTRTAAEELAAEVAKLKRNV